MNVAGNDPIPSSPPCQARPRARPIDLRAVHRALSAIAFALMLYIGVTGSWIQLLDLTAMLTGQPESDRTIRSMNEGKFGNGFYSAVTDADWSGAVLPRDLDVAKGVGMTLAAFHHARPGTVPAFVELRVVKGRTIGQAAFPDPNAPPDPRRFGVPLSALAFDARSGMPAVGSDVRGAYPAASLRQTLKQWHRFWGRGFFGTRDTPGVYVELLTGTILWVLIVTGLVMYFRLLKQRRRIKRRQLFWRAGGTWRSLHRATAIASSILLVLVAGSGTWLGFESSWATFNHHQPAPETLAITDAQAVRTARRAMQAFRADEPSTPIRAIRARIWYGQAEGAIVTAGTPTRQRVYDGVSGAEMSLSSPHYPPNPFPLGLDVHEWVKHFHSGELLGLPGQILNQLAGLSLMFLSISGLWMYIDLWLKRRRAGWSQLFWR